MANFQSLSTKTKNVTGNVMLGGFDIYDQCELLIKFKRWCAFACTEYALILHNADMKDDGDLKTPHIHFVLCLDSKNSPRLQTTLNRLVEALGVSVWAVSLFKTRNHDGDIQYLIHKNDTDKFQYPIESIVTNIERGELDAIMASDCKVLDTEYLFEVVASAFCRSDVVREIGLYYYRMYRGVINDMWNDLHPTENKGRYRNVKSSVQTNN